MPGILCRIMKRISHWLVGVAALALAACASTQDITVIHTSDPGVEEQAVREMLDRLYVAFCFAAKEEADWETQRALFAEGATFVAPFRAGGTPRGVDAETFLADFRSYILTSPRGKTGYHETITDTRIEVFGTIAHAYVLFDAFVPGAQPDARGVDSIQLVRGPGGWLLASFTTQYASADTPLPQRFLPR